MGIRRLCSATLLLALMPLFVAAAENEETTGTPVTKQELRGRWSGGSDRLRLDFEWGGEKHATVRQHYPGMLIAASLVPLENKETGAVDLRLDYKNAAGSYSAVIAAVERNQEGQLTLSILNIAAEISPDWQPVDEIPLKREERKGPE